MWLSKGARLIERFSCFVNRWVNRVGAIVLAMMMFLITADVALRYCLNSPISGSVELIEVMQVVVVFLAVAYTGSLKGHIAIDVVTSRFPTRARAINKSVACLISLGLVGLTSWWSVVSASSMRLRGAQSVMLHIPHYPFLIVVALAYALLAIVLLANLLDSLAQAVKK